MLSLGLGRRIIAACLLSLGAIFLEAASPPSAIRFELAKIPFRLENSETPARNAPETMPGGVAVFGSDTGWRLAFVPGETIAYKTNMDATIAESAMPFTNGLLEPLAATGGVLADLFSAEQEEVA